MNEMEKVTLAEDIRTALRMIIDPEIGKNIVDLGLVYDIVVEEGGVVYVTMTTTTRFCPATDFLKEAVQTCVWYVPGVEYAEVRLTYEPPWTPDMMLDAA
ncbi:UNVERIFIED_ORG: metal-sulfur cluster biosynthetic enzyme [Shinella zoogloeoides]|jgi:metal-sulfur cluster biosynthetic enzyme|nr:metal-sulfur cluster biosynthetic enzyme [Shinella zoogloeoides]